MRTVLHVGRNMGMKRRDFSGQHMVIEPKLEQRIDVGPMVILFLEEVVVLIVAIDFLL